MKVESRLERNKVRLFVTLAVTVLMLLSAAPASASGTGPLAGGCADFEVDVYDYVNDQGAVGAFCPNTSTDRSRSTTQVVLGTSGNYGDQIDNRFSTDDRPSLDIGDWSSMANRVASVEFYIGAEMATDTYCFIFYYGTFLSGTKHKYVGYHIYGSDSFYSLPSLNYADIDRYNSMEVKQRTYYQCDQGSFTYI